MSYQYVPSLFRLPEIPYAYQPTDGVWRGRGADEGYFGIFAGWPWGGYAIVRDGDFCFSLRCDGQTFEPVYSDVNGYIYWRGRGNYIYNTLTYGWVMSGRFPGYEPLENFVVGETRSDITWTGDEFYEVYGIPTGPDEVAVAEPRGSLRESGSEKELTAVWPRWVSRDRSEFGIYDPVDGVLGTRAMGLPRFRGAGEDFVRSIRKRGDHYTYGRIRYDEAAGKWAIGEIGSASGWHEGEEPQIGGTVTFAFRRNDDSEAEGSDIDVRYVEHVRGEQREAGYLGSVAAWR